MEDRIHDFPQSLGVGRIFRHKISEIVRLSLRHKFTNNLALILEPAMVARETAAAPSAFKKATFGISDFTVEPRFRLTISNLDRSCRDLLIKK